MFKRSRILAWSLVAALIAVTYVVCTHVFYKNLNRAEAPRFPNSAGDKVETESDFLTFEQKEFSWNQRVERDGSCPNFDLFTNPSVFMNNGRVIIKSYDTLIVDDTLSLYLSAIKKRPYRLRIVGYSKPNDGHDFMVMFEDVENRKHGECSVGGKNDDMRFRLRSFELQQKDQDGICFETPIAKVYDEIEGKEIILNNEEKFFEDRYDVVIKDLKGKEYVLRGVGSNVKIGEATCELRSFEQEKGSAKLLLIDADGNEFRKSVHLLH